MKTSEFSVLAAAIKTYYPRFTIFPNQEAMSLWYDALKDLPIDVLSAAVKKWAVTEKWPPTIAELREKCSEIVDGERPDWGTGWQEVQKAIRFYGYMRSQEALASMSPVTREAVRRIGFQAICESENPEAIRAQFRQIYESVEQRSAAESSLPAELKSTIRQIRDLSDKMALHD
jgi:hypothetical protein